ncbi:MAG: hypothetical protein AB199_02255 [Parcubacteria bacterium C7867-004]|nr:MAG: hypothetical protein AB199_02255 [Parcubacteria bacterium C7867-004]
MKTSRFLVSASALALALSAPIIAFAQSGKIGGSRLDTFLPSIVDFINSILIPFIFAIAFIVFIWGIFQYFIAGGANEEQRDKGKQLAVWGIIAFFVMISVWGMINLLVDTFGFGGQNAPKLPTFKPAAMLSVPLDAA